MAKQPDQPNRRFSPRKGFSSLDFKDSVTIFLRKGSYRVLILNRHVVIAEFFIVKGYPKKRHWSIRSDENGLQAEGHFKTLHAAVTFCLAVSV